MMVERRWCPNCEHSSKAFGLNRCALVTWDNGARDPQARAWLRVHQDDTTRIARDADHCPVFAPYKELAQRVALGHARLSRPEEVVVVPPDPPPLPGYYGTRRGSFGKVVRRYTNSVGIRMAVFQCGGVIFPVDWTDVIELRNRCVADAQAELQAALMEDTEQK
jgi:hypothetical protein